MAHNDDAEHQRAAGGRGGERWENGRRRERWREIDTQKEKWGERYGERDGTDSSV